jgi:hypothetical protein
MKTNNGQTIDNLELEIINNQLMAIYENDVIDFDKLPKEVIDMLYEDFLEEYIANNNLKPYDSLFKMYLKNTYCNK